MAAAIGNQYAAKDKRWKDAINRALDRRSKVEGLHELDRLADEFLNAVQAEGVAGFRELGDRLDGKPAQAVALSGDPEKPVAIVQKIEREVIKP